MDIKGLYRIVSRVGEGGFHLFQVEIDPSHPVFAGHFPGSPVLPGICTLMIVRECAERVLERSLVYSSIRENKFTQAVIPRRGTILTVRLKTALPVDGIYPLDAVVSEGNDVKVKLKAGVSFDE